MATFNLTPYVGELFSVLTEPILCALDGFKNVKERRRRRRFAGMIDSACALVLEHEILGHAFAEVDRIAEVRFSHKIRSREALVVDRPKDGYRVLVRGLNVDDTETVVWKAVERFIFCEPIRSRMDQDPTLAKAWPWVVFLHMCESPQLQDFMDFSPTRNYRRRTTSKLRNIVEEIGEAITLKGESSGAVALSPTEELILQHNLSMIGQFAIGSGGGS